MDRRTFNAATLLALAGCGGDVEYPLQASPRRAAPGINVPVPSYIDNFWTPTLMFNGVSTGITYHTLNGGVYRKIGNCVELWGELYLTSKGAAAGNAEIGGLPFPVRTFAANIPNGYPEVGARIAIWNGLLSNVVDLSLFFLIGTTDRFFLFKLAAAGTSNVSATMTEADVGNTMNLRFFISYHTTDI